MNSIWIRSQDEYAAKLPPDGKVARLVAEKIKLFVFFTSKLHIFQQEQQSYDRFFLMFDYFSDWF